MMILLTLKMALIIGSVPSGSASLSLGRLPIADILGVAVGDSFDEAKERLEKLSDSDEDENRREEKEEGEDVAAFRLKGTDFKMVVVRGVKEKVGWISAFSRDPDGIPFDNFGDPALCRAAGGSPSTLATWEVKSSGHAYRVIAQGKNGRALVVTLLSQPNRLRHGDGSARP